MGHSKVRLHTTSFSWIQHSARQGRFKFCLLEHSRIFPFRIIFNPWLADFTDFMNPSDRVGALTLAELTVVEVPWLPVDEPVSL